MTNGALALLRKLWASLMAWAAAMDYSAADYTNDRIGGLEREVEQLKDELRRTRMSGGAADGGSETVLLAREPIGGWRNPGAGRAEYCGCDDVGDFHAKRCVRLRRDTEVGADGLSVPPSGWAQNVWLGSGYIDRWRACRSLLRLVRQGRQRCRELSSQPEYRRDLRN